MRRSNSVDETASLPLATPLPTVGGQISAKSATATEDLGGGGG